MYKYRFSIFTATYNRADMLREVAQYVINQTFRGGYEWIIVSDGSTDNTAEVVEEIKRQTDIPIKFVNNKENRGKHAAWRDATRLFEGQYICAADDDDPISLDMLTVFDRYWRQLEQQPDYDKFWEIRARCQYEDGQLVGHELPTPWFDSDYNEVSFKLNKACEFDSCRKVEVLRNEAAVPETFLYDGKCSNYAEVIRWSRAARKYKTRFVPDVLRTYVRGHESLCNTKSRRWTSKKAYNHLVMGVHGLNEFGDLQRRYKPRAYVMQILITAYASIWAKEPVLEHLLHWQDRLLTFLAYIPAAGIYLFKR